VVLRLKDVLSQGGDTRHAATLRQLVAWRHGLSKSLGAAAMSSSTWRWKGSKSCWEGKFKQALSSRRCFVMSKAMTGRMWGGGKKVGRVRNWRHGEGWSGSNSSV
jgi:hypothetical protein